MASSSISSLANSSNSSISSVATIDTTPDPFSFTPVTGAAFNANVMSTAINISGINTAVPIDIANGEYSIDGGAFTSAAGTVTNGQTVALRLISAATVSTTSQAAVTVGGITSTFSVTTTNILGGAVQGTPLNIAGVVTTTAGALQGTDGVSTAARFNSPAGAVIVGAYLYVADASNHKIRRIEIATGVVTTLAGSGSEGSADGKGAAASFNAPMGIATDGTHLYVADINNNKIRKIVIANGVVTTLAGSGSRGSTNGIGAAASFYLPAGIATDGTHLYVADTYNHQIRKIEITTGTVTWLAGSGMQGSSDGIGAAASFYRPYDIAIDGAYLYVADTYNHKIRKIEITTGAVTTLAGSGPLAGSADGTGAAAGFFMPSGITTDGTYLYVADTDNHKIRKIEIATAVVTTLAGRGSRGSADGIGTAASFHYPDGITTDGTHLYVADFGNDAIRKIEIATAAVTWLAGSSDKSADGTGLAAIFYSPAGITTDGTHLYVADTNNHKIRKIEIATGVVTTLAGSGSIGSADGTGTAARFSSPEGITTDGTHLYIADTWNHKIRKIVIATGVVTTLAGNYSYGSADGIGLAASFDLPTGITTDGTNLYVADAFNKKIRKIEVATSVVTTLAGSGSSESVDGTGAAASFDRPTGITTDGTYLYVTDKYGNKIRKIVIATGVVTTLAGSGLQGSADGTGAAAKFNYPSNIVTDSTHLYVADYRSHKIRKIEIATGIVTTLAGGDAYGSDDGVGTAARFREPTGITTDGFALYVTDSGNNTIRKIE
uniref:hypothetical protein n=1 Tax=Cellvibrio fontiphilus TaxID=1815559 RepID=UPI002B4BFE80|nr:hypothetical protein [Cellvibrio fontiphilus]